MREYAAAPSGLDGNMWLNFLFFFSISVVPLEFMGKEGGLGEGGEGSDWR